MQAAWARLLDGPRFPVEAGWIGETPLIASADLIGRLDDRIAALVGWLGPRLSRRDDPDWPLAPAADVLSADLAIVEAPDRPGGWDLRWVELQTFTSLLSTIYTLHRAACEVWPELEARAFWSTPPGGRDWLDATRAWMAPDPDSILLEHDPWAQPTRPDFEAARRWFGVTPVDPRVLRLAGGRLDRASDDGTRRPVRHIANRLILHEAANPESARRLLAAAPVTWNSHPAWYYRVDKGVMPDLPLPPSERCARGDRWRTLDLPPEALVAKACHSHSGRAVKLHLGADGLDALDNPTGWIVQPRFTPRPLREARDGHPLYGEIRCILALPAAGEAPWLVCRLVRMTRGPFTSTASWSGAPGEGAVPLYAPPA